MNDVDCGGPIGDGIPNVTVTKTATTVTPCFPGVPVESEFFPFGFYEFSQSLGSQSLYYTPYTIKPSKTSSTDTCCGVDMNDYDLFNNNWILGLVPMTNAEVLAADFNASGTVTLTDKWMISRCILGLGIPSSNFPSGWLPWRFAPYDNFPPESTAVSPFGNSIPDYLNCFYDPLNGGLNLSSTSFWGVKRGDLNGSCEECGASIVSDDNDERNGEQYEGAIKLNMPDFGLITGQEALVPIRTEKIDRASDILLELMADPKSYDVLSVENGDLSAEYASWGAVQGPSEIALKYGWMNNEQEGVQIPENTVLFYVKVRAKKDISTIKNTLWLRPQGSINLVRLAGQSRKLKFEVNTTPLNNGVFSAAFKGENLLTGYADIWINTPAPCTVKFSMIDGNGHNCRVFTQDLIAGYSEMHLQNLPQQPGIYTLFILSPFGQRTLRFIKL